jgi:hypothetical protein
MSEDSAGMEAVAPEWDFWKDGLDRQFFSRVYGRSAQLAILGAVAGMAFDQRPVALGLLVGLAGGLFSLWSMEATIRILFREGSFPHAKLAFGALVKFPLLMAGLLGAAWAGLNGYLNIFGALGGMLIVHGTMLLMVIATSMSSEAYNTERYR